MCEAVLDQARSAQLHAEVTAELHPKWDGLPAVHRRAFVLNSAAQLLALLATFEPETRQFASSLAQRHRHG